MTSTIGQISLISSGVTSRAVSMPIDWNTAQADFSHSQRAGVAGDVDAAGHVQADVLAGLRLDLAIETDGVVLQRRDVGIGIERMETRRRVPGRTGGQFGALDQRDVGPAELRQVVEHRGADHATPDDDCTVVRLQGFPPGLSEAGTIYALDISV